MGLPSCFWQLPLAAADRHKTCFQWKGQLYQFTRLPFGLKTAGGVFCRAISRALSSADFDLLSTFIYLDDICIMSKDFNTFVRALEKVFIGLKRFNLRLSAKKCKFLTKTIEFLGRKISEDKMEPTAANLEGIFAMEPPKSKLQLQSLIGSLGWLRGFIGTKMGKRVATESFSHHMVEINKCNRHKKFTWTREADLAFAKIKQKLNEAPFISFFDPTLPIVLATDASDYALGAILMQMAGINDFRVIGCISKTFNESELKWSCTEKEAFAIRYAVEKWTYYLAKTHFTIMTDHRALTFIDRTDFKNPKVNRLRLC